jgi:taurine--2-oxoglutarate transaminase
MIADEVMCGWGRCGEWFAVNRWNVVPDIITTAKGLTSSYAPLGAVGLTPAVADYFTDNVFWSGLTYNTHPLGVAAAIAAIEVMQEEGLIERARAMEPVLRRHHEELAARHPSVGLHRNIGLFGIVELVKSRETMEPLSPFNTVNETMASINRFLLDNGVATFVRWHSIMTNPPLIISEEELAAGFEVLDKALEIADQAMSVG